MPGPETAWSLPRSTGSADPSPRSPAPSPISVNGESRCMSHAKASIRPRQQGELSRPSWPASPNWSSNWAASARRIPRIPSRPASAGHQTPEAQPRTARTVAPACCDRGACASTGRSVRNRTSNCIPLSLLFPNLKAPEWLLASARSMRSRQYALTLPRQAARKHRLVRSQYLAPVFVQLRGHI
jgi:hypothetical protein